MANAVACAVVAAILLVCDPCSGQGKSKQIQIYDEGRYSEEELRTLARAPVTVPSPSYGRDGEIRIPKSLDEHYQVHGFVNGFPLLFMVDTGASTITIPLRFARSSGIRAGVVTEVQTGGGRVKMGVSSGNRVGVGTVALDDMQVAVSDQIPIAVLGMNALQKFRVVIDEHGWMTLTPIR